MYSKKSNRNLWDIFCLFFALFLTAQKYSSVMHLILSEEQCQIAYSGDL